MNNEEEVIYEWLWEYKYDDSDWGGSFSPGSNKWEVLSYNNYYTKEEIWDTKGKIYHPDKSFQKIEKTKRIRTPKIIVEVEKDNKDKNENTFHQINKALKAKKIYTVINNGVDGREKDTIVNSFNSEEEREMWLHNSPNKNYYRKGEHFIAIESNDEEEEAKSFYEKYKAMKDKFTIADYERNCFKHDFEKAKEKNEELLKKIKRLENELNLAKESNINFGY